MSLYRMVPDRRLLSRAIVVLGGLCDFFDFADLKNNLETLTEYQCWGH